MPGEHGEAEVTVEYNPDTVRADLLGAYRSAGVNRLSMGAQSFDDAELRGLGRIHDAGRPSQAFAAARARLANVFGAGADADE